MHGQFQGIKEMLQTGPAALKPMGLESQRGGPNAHRTVVWVNGVQNGALTTCTLCPTE